MFVRVYVCLLSATYVSCLLAVESYWPEANGVRNALTQLIRQIDPADINKMHELALWVTIYIFALIYICTIKKI